jgi:DNA-binding MarR family transcriptional regulator
VAVAVLLWYRRGVTRSPEVIVGRTLRDRFAVSQQSFRRALASLECAGLVMVERSVGRSPRITLLDLPTDRPP